MLLDLRLGALNEPLTGRSLAGADCARQARERAQGLRRAGLKRRDRVFLHYANTLDFFVDLMAVWWAGGCAVPVDPRFTPFEVETLAQAVIPRLSFWDGPPDEGLAGRLAALGAGALDRAAATPPGGAAPDPGPHEAGDLHLDDDALILFTSGTTGDPKGVVHTHRSLRARWTSLRDSVGLGGFDRALCLLPTHFGHGLICNSLFPWLFGRDLFVVPPFRSELIAQLGTLIDEHRITFLSSVPAMWRLALKTAPPPRRGTLQRVFCGSAPLSAALWQGIRDWTGAPEVANAYGITETASWLAGTTVPGVRPADGLIGVPWGGVVKVLKNGSTEVSPVRAEACLPGEPGHVWVQTPALMKGYAGRDDLTRRVVAQGWFLTGDIGFVDDRGLLYLCGREREEINVGGMKVYPGDVDTVVERFDGVADACTFAYDDPLLGENVGIAVVVRNRGGGLPDGLYGWVARHLAPHQIPRRWYVVDEILRTDRGKVNREQVARTCDRLAPVDPPGRSRATRRPSGAPDA